jgi:putative DNA-invertase from lambdoid prophage Rac
VFKETASGAKKDRVERKKVLALAQAREIDAILITELSRWGRSTQDLVQTLDDLHSWKISSWRRLELRPQHRPAVSSCAPSWSSLAKVERDLIRDGVTSGLTAARVRGVVLGRQEGQLRQPGRRRR